MWSPPEQDRETENLKDKRVRAKIRENQRDRDNIHRQRRVKKNVMEKE